MPANAQGIQAGGAYYRLSSESSGLVAGLKKAEGLVRASVTKITRSGGTAISGAKALLGRGGLSALYAAAGTALASILPASAIKTYASIGAELVNVARRTNTAAREIASLGYAARQTGQDVGSMESALKTVRDKIVEAARGGEGAQLAFARLNLNFLALSRMKPDEALRAVADRLNAIPNNMLRAAAAAEVLGNADLLPTIQRMRELEARAKALGIVMSEADLQAAKRLDESFTDLWMSVQSLGQALGAKLAPDLQGLLQTATEFVGKGRDWVQTNFDVGKSWEAIKSGAAALWDGLKSAWDTGTTYLRDKWNAWTGAIESTWIDLKATVQSALADITDFAQKVFAKLEKAWQKLQKLGGRAEKLSAPWDEPFRAALGMKPNEKLQFGFRDPIKAALLPEKVQQEAAAGRVRIDAHNQRLVEIENARRKAQADLARRQAAARNDKAFALLPGLGLAGLGQKLLALFGGAAGKKKPPEPAPASRVRSGAAAGIGSALFHVRGIGAEDVRSAQGFASIFASLRQQSNPQLQLEKQSFALQQREFIEQQRMRIALEATRVRKAGAI